MANYTTQDLKDNLDYINETKKQIKQAIIDKGQTVEDSDTFRSYVDKIEAIETNSGIRIANSVEEMDNLTLRQGDVTLVQTDLYENAIVADTDYQAVVFPHTISKDFFSNIEKKTYSYTQNSSTNLYTNIIKIDMTLESNKLTASGDISVKVGGITTMKLPPLESITYTLDTETNTFKLSCDYTPKWVFGPLVVSSLQSIANVITEPLHISSSEWQDIFAIMRNGESSLNSICEHLESNNVNFHKSYRLYCR